MWKTFSDLNTCKHIHIFPLILIELMRPHSGVLDINVHIHGYIVFLQFFYFHKFDPNFKVTSFLFEGMLLKCILIYKKVQSIAFD